MGGEGFLFGKVVYHLKVEVFIVTNTFTINGKHIREMDVFWKKFLNIYSISRFLGIYRVSLSY